MSEPKVHTQAAIATALGAEAVQAYVATLEAEVARLQARERELEADLDDCRSALGADQ